MLHTWVTKAARTCDNKLALLLFPRTLPKNKCVHETVMTGMSRNACDLKIRNSYLKYHWTYCNTHLTEKFHRSSSLLLSLNRMSAFVLFIRQHVHIDWINVSAPHDFSTAQCQISRDQGVIWCHARVPTVMMISRGCQILPSAVTLLCVCLFCSFCKKEWERYKVWWKSGCLGRDASVPALRPAEPSALIGARPSKVQPEMVSWHTRALMAKCRMR